jgi:hypothetical protein
LLLLSPGQKLFAEDAVSKQELSQALQQATKNEDYSWLNAKRQEKAAQNGFFTRLNRDLDNIFDTLHSWFSNFKRWLRQRWENNKPKPEFEPTAKPVSGEVRWLLYALAAVVVLSAVVFLWRSRIGSTEPVALASSAAHTPDLNTENVLASDRARIGSKRRIAACGTSDVPGESFVPGCAALPANCSFEIELYL